MEAICKGVQANRLPNLAWLELLGTQCDVTPYLDGYHWRMTETARGLAKHYSVQEWMTLGKMGAEGEHYELLSQKQRNNIPPNRFLI